MKRAAGHISVRPAWAVSIVDGRAVLCCFLLARLYILQATAVQADLAAVGQAHDNTCRSPTDDVAELARVSAPRDLDPGHLLRGYEVAEVATRSGDHRAHRGTERVECILQSAEVRAATGAANYSVGEGLAQLALRNLAPLERVHAQAKKLQVLVVACRGGVHRGG